MNKWQIDKLLYLISKGNNKAFEILYEKTKRGVYAFIYNYLQNHCDTEDAMQTVYLKIKMNIGSYKIGTNGRAWILQIAKNQALSDIKKRKWTEPFEELSSVLKSEDTYSQGVFSEMKKCLTSEEIEIVTLHILWGYKHREISEMLSVPVGTITSKYKRSIEKLKQNLKE